MRDGIPSPCEGSDKPNGYLFVVPKNSVNVSMIVHMVKFHKAHAHKPVSFSLPTVEDLAYLIEIHGMNLPELALGGRGAI